MSLVAISQEELIPNLECPKTTSNCTFLQYKDNPYVKYSLQNPVLELQRWWKAEIVLTFTSDMNPEPNNCQFQS